MDTQLSPISGEQKDAIIADAESTPDFRAYHDYFIDELDYEISDVYVTERKNSLSEKAYVVSFMLDADHPDTTAELNILLEDDEVGSNASIKYEFEEATSTEYFSYENGSIRQSIY